MHAMESGQRIWPVLVAGLLLAGCSAGRPVDLAASAPAATVPRAASGSADAALAGLPRQTVTPAEKFAADRQSILAMAGNYHVTFNFIETVPYEAGYEPKKPSHVGGDEVVRVIADTGNFISLQHLLVADTKDGTMVVKHWRQDWQFEPERVFQFVGGNAWRMVSTTPAEVEGKWAQSVYQVDDSPRYAAIAAWTHEDGVSAWTPPRNWRPLPRRDATKRDDYDVIAGVNRQVITPFGWVHEQDNEKLALRGKPQVLVREIAYNVYRRADDFNYKAADEYWSRTRDFWAQVRADWTKIENTSDAFGLTVQGEAEDVYIPILEAADGIDSGSESLKAAEARAEATIETYTTTDIGTLAERIAKRKQLPEKEKSASGSSKD